MKSKFSKFKERINCASLYLEEGTITENNMKDLYKKINSLKLKLKIFIVYKKSPSSIDTCLKISCLQRKSIKYSIFINKLTKEVEINYYPKKLISEDYNLLYFIRATLAPRYRIKFYNIYNFEVVSKEE